MWRPVAEFGCNAAGATLTVEHYGPAGIDANVALATQTDFSRARALMFQLVLTSFDGNVANLLDVYVQNRWLDGFWLDRIHFGQFTGAMTSPIIRQQNLLPIATVAAEFQYTPSSSNDGVRLAAGAYKNGAFAPPFHSPGLPQAAGWRVETVLVNTDAAANFVGTVYVYADNRDDVYG